MRTMVSAALLAGTLLPVPMAAQDLIDPATRIKKIMDEVVEEMREVDRLLVESARAPERAGRAIEETVERVEELIRQTRENQGAVVRGIDSLIEEIEKLGGT